MSSLTTTNLDLIRGDTGTWTVSLTDPATGSAYALSGCSLRMALWQNSPDATVTTDSGASLVLSSPSSGISITNAAAGQVTVSISKTQSQALVAELYAFDMQVTNPAGEEYTAARGVLWVKDQYTHTS